MAIKTNNFGPQKPRLARRSTHPRLHTKARPQLSRQVRQTLAETGVVGLLTAHSLTQNPIARTGQTHNLDDPLYLPHRFLMGQERFDQGVEMLNISNGNAHAVAASVQMMQMGLRLAETPAFDMMTDKGRHTTLGQGKLDTLIHNRLRHIQQTKSTEGLEDLYSVGIILGNMTDLNTLFSNSAGTHFKNLAYLVIRAFYDSGAQSVGEFIETFDPHLITNHYASDTNLGQTTLVNSVIINVQTQDLEATTDLMNNLPELMKATIAKLVEASESGHDVSSALGDFTVRNGEVGYIIRDSKGLEKEFKEFSKANPHKIVAGLSTYNRNLDEEFLKHLKNGEPSNNIWVQTEIGRMIDDVVQKAEWADKNASSSNRLSMSIPENQRPKKLAWRMGRHLTHTQILDALFHLYPENQPRPFDPYAKGKRMFKKFSIADLIGDDSNQPNRKVGVLEIAAVHFLENYHRLPENVQAEIKAMGYLENDFQDIALDWAVCFERTPKKLYEGDKTYEAHIKKLEHVAYALQFTFMEQHDNALVDVLFKDMEGVIRPLRWHRRYSDYNHAASRIIEGLQSGTLTQDEATTQAQDLAKVGQKLLDLSGYNIITGDTVPRELAPDYSVRMVRNHYKSLRTHNQTIPLHEQGFYAIGIEAKNAKVIEDVSPITGQDKLDKHMGLIRRVARFALEEIFGSEAKNIMSKLMVSTDPQGDEIAVIIPKHDLNGNLIDPAKMNAFRKAMQQILHFDSLHYNHKQKVASGTLRHKMWKTHMRLPAKLARGLGVRNFQDVVIAAAQNAFDKNGDHRAWILSVNGKRLKEPFYINLNKHKKHILGQEDKYGDHQTLVPYLGRIDARICVVSRSLVDDDGTPLTNDELRELIDSDIDFAQDLDNWAKKQSKPEEGVWLYVEESDRIIQVGTIQSKTRELKL